MWTIGDVLRHKHERLAKLQQGDGNMVMAVDAPKSGAVRPLYVIAREITRDWRNASPDARPYIVAMASLRSINDSYGLDSGDDIVLRFLVNAAKWKGDVARRVKAELNSILKARK